MTRAMEWALNLSLLLLIIGCSLLVPDAVDRQAIHNIRIIEQRCERAWINGYCDVAGHKSEVRK